LILLVRGGARPRQLKRYAASLAGAIRRMEPKLEEPSINDLWEEHLATPFPKGFRGKDLNGIDFVVLDADIAGCVQTFVERGKLNMFQTSMLGLSYRDATFVIPTLNDEGAAYFWRLERLAELVLKAIARENKRAA
jgi:hypothetical protein